MNYYEVLVASQRYHGQEALTYHYEDGLPIGQIVGITLQRQKVVGVVSASLADKPDFTTKPIDMVVGSRPLPAELLKLVDWLKDYYPAPLGAIMQMLLPGTLLQTSRTAYKPKPTTQSPLPPLTAEQQQAVERISSVSEGLLLLHGETGTGKTRVYLELARRQLSAGRSVIALTPEIGLTPQLAATFEAAFDNVVVMHSNLTPAERRKRWLAILESDRPVVVVGPRSALFVPVHKLGLIIIDEAHDGAYKQEQQPHYQASRVAAVLGKLHGAPVVMGTATPLVADYYALEQKNLPVVRMTQPAIDHASPAQIELVKINERDNFSRSPFLSDQLLAALEKTLEQREQALIFLNRRGTARLVLCEQCGWTATCPRCDLSLTYHGDSHQMRCHVCNFHEPAPSRCPDCGHTDIAYRNVGTKSIVSELERLFPQSRIRRFDTDLKKDERLEAAYQAIKDGEVDILVGTQMLAKGLDLPGLSLVGVVVADTSLFIPDFSAEEHSYQLMSQIIGRVGRGHRHGYVVIQAYHPENPALAAAVDRDYQTFYKRQLAERQAFDYPPFAYLLKLIVGRASPGAAEKAARQLAETIGRLKLPIQLVGPGPAFHEKLHGKYRWQLTIKARQRAPLIEIIRQLPGNVSYDIDPHSLI